MKHLPTNKTKENEDIKQFSQIKLNYKREYFEIFCYEKNKRKVKGIFFQIHLGIFLFEKMIEHDKAEESGNIQIVSFDKSIQQWIFHTSLVWLSLFSGISTAMG